MNKKILISAGIVTLLIIIGGISFLFLKNSDSESGGGIQNFFPFGQANNDGGVAQTNTDTVQQVEPENVPSRVVEENGLQKITSAPISGATFIKSSTSTEHIVRFVERATGHIYDANLETKNITRVSNTTIPKIESLSWNSSGNAFIAQMTDSGRVQSKIIEIASQTGTSTENQFARIDEFSLPDNLISPSFSNQNNIFYLSRGISGIEGFLTNQRGENPRKIWEFPTTEWLAEWTSGAVALTSKASNSTDGTLYLLNPNSQETIFTFSGIPGLTTKTSPSGKSFIYSISSDVSLETHIYSIDRKDGFISPFVTLAEKCVWTTDETKIYCFQPRNDLQNALPDSWYQGIVSLNDRLWSMDTASGETRMISELTTLANEFVDAVDPIISSDGQYVLFKNKKDLSLWAIKVGE